MSRDSTFLRLAGLLVLALLAVGCGTSSKPRTGYIDCRSIGHTVSVSDARGDTITRRYTGGAEDDLRVNAPWIDLISVVVAFSNNRFCADFITAAPTKAVTTFYFFALPGGSSSTQLWEPSLAIGTNYSSHVQLFENTPVKAHVARSGESTSLLINMSDVPPGKTLRSPFTFHVLAAYLPPRGDPHNSVIDGVAGFPGIRYP